MTLSRTPAPHDEGDAVRILAERDGEIASLTRTLADRDRTIAYLNQLAGERGRSLQDAEAANVALRAELTRIYQSRSWQLTGPLRWLLRRAFQGRAAMVTLLWAFRRRGPKATLTDVRRIRQDHGITGVKFWLLNGVAPGGAAQGEPGTDLAATKGALADVRGPDGYVYRAPRRPADLDARLKDLSTTFSIVVPIYNTPPALLEAAIRSVEAQWYPHWQLVLVDDASPNPATRAALEQPRDPRVTILRQPANQGISGATNAGLAAATGDFVVFLDHDDELTADCLYELALCIAAHDPDFVYSDEDKITEDGRFTQPFFKPDWSPDTMMSTMYTCHVSCVRRSLVNELGGLRPEYDGCQDWDLVLRLAERTTRIQHVTKVLYHWRIIPQSTAADLNAKPYVVSVSERLRADTLARRGLKGTLEPLPQLPSYHRVRYDIRGTPTISIIIPSRDNQPVLSACLDSIRARSSYDRYEIVVLDNGSREPATLGYLNRIRAWPGVKVIRHDAPFNYSELNNLGVAAATGDILLFLNDDTEVLTTDWLERMAGYAQLDHVGAVGAKLLYPGGEKVQHAGVLNLFNGPSHAFLRQDRNHYGYFLRNLLEYNWLAVTGACLMVERRKFEAVGGFDETLPIAYNDVDLCMRLHEVGYYNVMCQAAELIHHESISRGLDFVSPEKMARLEQERGRLYDRHPGLFLHDPFGNPNLHPNGGNFEIA
ncbi:glycosyltransferase family 2 protein [Nitrospirillum viridazoti]|uniref:Glycosyl transferase family 2 n=1 Tax=Nitrospirillum viridazoti CBAmc TaxID=1441467 RepID=A0A248JYS2_9PROT|nr:glycosyltransferase family 2 protein [Nitrospirillum amazonense]ASG23709.1 glycosyl transferase family 2 [Nitrospirillum amazonense CBAmc]